VPIRIKRPIRIEVQVAYVQLTKGYEAVIDAADIHLVDGCNWTASVQSNAVYAHRKDYSLEKSKKVFLHRVIMCPPDNLHVDHVNGNGLDNRRKNLRLATRSQNLSNSVVPVTNTSGFKGVVWEKRRLKWFAQIQKNGRHIFLGYYSSAQLAHEAYCEASAKFHGEFGRTK
jgi:HNH endonuclease/AP2 domain